MTPDGSSGCVCWPYVVLHPWWERRNQLLEVTDSLFLILFLLSDDLTTTHLKGVNIMALQLGSKGKKGLIEITGRGESIWERKYHLQRGR